MMKNKTGLQPVSMACVPQVTREVKAFYSWREGGSRNPNISLQHFLSNKKAPKILLWKSSLFKMEPRKVQKYKNAALQISIFSATNPA